MIIQIIVSFLPTLVAAIHVQVHVGSKESTSNSAAGDTQNPIYNTVLIIIIATLLVALCLLCCLDRPGGHSFNEDSEHLPSTKCGVGNVSGIDTSSKQPSQTRNVMAGFGEARSDGDEQSNILSTQIERTVAARQVEKIPYVNAPALVFNMNTVLTVPERPTGEFDLKGRLGKALLRATFVTSSDGQQSLAINSISDDVPRSTILTAVSGQSFDLYDSRKVLYGTLEPDGGGKNIHFLKSVEEGDLPVMRIETESTVAFSAMTMGGTQLGCATRTIDTEPWEITVRPGADLVLIPICILALLLFQSG